MLGGYFSKGYYVLRKDQVMGDRNHRAWVGPPDYYDRLGAVQFVTLLLLGLREDHFLLDKGGCRQPYILHIARRSVADRRVQSHARSGTSLENR